MKEIMLNGLWLSVEKTNPIFELGYTYIVEGDFEMTDSIDPRSGMEEVKGNTHFFDNYEEAKAYAERQRDPYTGSQSTIQELTYRKTWEQLEAEKRAKEEAKRAKKDAKDRAVAEAMNLTLEEYKEYTKLLKWFKANQEEIKACEAEIERLKIEIIKNFVRNEELKAKIIAFEGR